VPVPQREQRGQQIGRIDLVHEWDAVLLVLLDVSFEATVIHEADRPTVVAALMAPGSRARNERGALAISRLKSIGQQIWP
jgi:hypothetical protein